MTKHRVRFSMSLAASSLVLLALVATASPVAAKGAKAAKFTGAAPGSVTCQVSANVAFSPPLTASGGGTNPSTVKAALSGCTPTDGTVAITSASAAGTFATSPLSCVTKSATGAAPTLTITWKGTVSGGKAAFTQTMVSGGTATGSFAGTALVTLPFPASATASCAKKKGIPKLTLTGTITISTLVASGLVSDGAGYCAVVTGGAVECWGAGADGELGNGMTSSSDVPVAVNAVGGSGTLAGVASIVSDGPLGYCALLISGGVDCWGYNANGELGNGSTTDSDVPVAVSGLGGSGTLAGVASVASDGFESGAASYCAVLTSGAVDCWGANASGQLGNGSTTDSDVPVAATGITTAAGIAGAVTTGPGGSYCAVLTGGAVDCWGDNTSGELGNGTTTSSDVPVAVSGVTTAASIVGGVSADYAGSYCAVLTGGAVDCWGDNLYGELGGGATGGPDCVGMCNPTPGAVSGSGGSGTLSGVTSLVSDDLGYCAVLTTAAVDCWGFNASGELGDGTTTDSDVPVAVSAISTASAIAGTNSAGAAGAYCALLAAGAVDCWGYNGYGELGNATTTNSSVPVPVSGIASATSLAGGAFGNTGSYCAVLTSGVVECWGDNANGELGNGTTTNSDVPVPVSNIV